MGRRARCQAGPRALREEKGEARERAAYGPRPGLAMEKEKEKLGLALRLGLKEEKRNFLKENSF